MIKVERIDLDDYVQTGEGGTALTYTRKDGKTLAKLYNLGFEADRVRMHSFKQEMVRFYQETDTIPEDYSRRVLDFLEKVPESEYLETMRRLLFFGETDFVCKKLRNFVPKYFNLCWTESSLMATSPSNI